MIGYDCPGWGKLAAYEAAIDAADAWDERVSAATEDIIGDIASMVRNGNYDPEQAVGLSSNRLWETCFLVESENNDFWSVFDQDHADDTGEFRLLPGVTAEQAAEAIEASESIAALVAEQVQRVLV